MHFKAQGYDEEHTRLAWARAIVTIGTLHAHSHPCRRGFYAEGASEQFQLAPMRLEPPFNEGQLVCADLDSACDTETRQQHSYCHHRAEILQLLVDRSILALPFKSPNSYLLQSW